MSGIASRQNEILSKLGFNSYGAREFLPGNLDNEIVVPDINQYFSDQSIPLSKVDFVIYDAVVDQTGRGTHLTIQDALNSGKKRIFVRAGTYILTSAITISTSDILITGESKYNTIINLNGDNELQSIGSNIYSTGTVTATNGSNVITGLGTLWLTQAGSDGYLILNGNTYNVNAVNSDTELEIDVNYFGHTESGISYFVGDFINNVSISNLTITGQDVSAATGAIKFFNVINSFIDNVIVTKNDVIYTNGIYLYRSFNNKISNIRVDNNGNSGIFLSHSDYNILDKIVCNNNDGYGVFLNSSDKNSLSNIFSSANDYYGILISSGCSENKIMSCYCLNNTFNGIHISSADRTIVTNCHVIGNLGNGIDVVNSENCVISNNFVGDNSQKINNAYTEILLNQSSYCTVSGNSIHCSLANKSAYGIEEARSSGTSDYNLISNNIIRGVATQSILILGANTIIGNNIEV